MKRGQSAASTAAAAVEHRKHSHDRYRIPASELRAGDILVDCTEFEPRYLRVRSLTREESALDVTFRDDLTTRISRFEMVTVVRGYMTPYIREDGSIDHVRWAEDHCEDMSGADL